MIAIASSVLTFILLFIFATPALASWRPGLIMWHVLVLYVTAGACVGVILWGAL